MKALWQFWIALEFGLVTGAVPLAAPSWDGPPENQNAGVFWHWHWYKRGLTNGNPAYDRRFRVNAPETSLHPTFGRRVEARENGMMQIEMNEDLFLLSAAEFYCEAWGGHPGTANKRIVVNGRAQYSLPRVGTEKGHCTYFYPNVPLTLSDLVNGYNAIQFAIDKGSAFWGHMLIDNAAIRVALTNDHPYITTLGLGKFTATVRTRVLPGHRGYELELLVPQKYQDAIATVDFQGWYEGYDENGNLQSRDWHGFTKNRLPMATLGVVHSPPFSLIWNTELLPAQRNVAVRAAVRFKADTNLVFSTAATTGLVLEHAPGTKVAFLVPRDLPVPFWSRAGELKTCQIDMDLAPECIEAAELHVVTWTGGAGATKEYFKFNEVHYPVAEGERHELIYNRLPVNPRTLKRGSNKIELLSTTDHHGIEVMLPGPALAIRYRTH